MMMNKASMESENLKSVKKKNNTNETGRNIPIDKTPVGYNKSLTNKARQSSTCIYIKDESFLPDVIEIKVNTLVLFRNEDRITHNVECKGFLKFGTISVGQNSEESFCFESPGRYVLNGQNITNMKVSFFISSVSD
jgi:plastocyanin